MHGQPDTYLFTHCFQCGANFQGDNCPNCDPPGPFPGFKAQFGREPEPGRDFDPDGDFCQDDYEYFTGTGRYY